MSDFIEGLCRTCMSTNANVNVATQLTVQYYSPTIMELLQYIQPQIPVHSEDELPKMMCRGCVEQLKITYKFLKLCKETDKKFRKLLQKEDFNEDDQILDYPPACMETQIVAVKKEHTEGGEHESPITKFEIEIFEDDSNYQHPDFETSFMFNRSGEQAEFVGNDNYEDESILSTTNEYDSIPWLEPAQVLDHRSSRMPKKGRPRDGISLSVPFFLREGCAKVLQRSRNVRKHKLASKNKQKAKGKSGRDTSDATYEESSFHPLKAIAIGPPCASAACFKCKYRHCEEFSEEVRNNIFQNFWSLSNREKRLFVRDHVELVDKKRKKTVENSRKHNTFVFKLPNGDVPTPVCRTMFLQTLSISKNLFRAWITEENLITTNKRARKKNKEEN